MNIQNNKIKESGMATIKEVHVLKDKILCLIPQEFFILCIKHGKYRESYVFKKGEENIMIDFCYTGSGIISQVIDNTNSPASKNLCETLNKLKTLNLCMQKKVCAVNSFMQLIDFREYEDYGCNKEQIVEFIRLIYDRICEPIQKEGIGFKIELLSEYQIRCYFEQGIESAVFDVYRNKNFEITNFYAQPTLSNSPELIAEIKKIAEKLKNAKEDSDDEC